MKLELGKKYTTANPAIQFIKIVYITEALLCDYPVVAEVHWNSHSSVNFVHYNLYGINEYDDSCNTTGEYLEAQYIYANIYNVSGVLCVGECDSTREKVEARACHGRVACVKFSAKAGVYDE